MIASDIAWLVFWTIVALGLLAWVHKYQMKGK